MDDNDAAAAAAGPRPEDFVIANGKQYSVRQFFRWSAAEMGVTLRFEGRGVDVAAQPMCVERVAADLEVARRHAFLRAHGHEVPVSREAGA